MALAAAARLELPFVASDNYWWEPEWQSASREAVYAAVTKIANQPAWVLESNFDSLRDTLWRRADLVVWLDYQRHVVLSRVARRNIGWALKRAEVWSGNRMTMRRAWSGIRHAMRSYSEKRRNYPKWLAESAPRYVRLGHPRDADQWLRGEERGEG